MRTLAISLAVLALLTVPASAEGRTYYNGCGYRARIKPARLDLACTATELDVRAVTWPHWGNREARGRSRRAVARDCRRGCAYHVGVTLRRPVRCPATARLTFSRLTIEFLGRQWQGRTRVRRRLYCPPVPARPAAAPALRMRASGSVWK